MDWFVGKTLPSQKIRISMIFIVKIVYFLLENTNLLQINILIYFSNLIKCTKSATKCNSE